MSHVSHLGHRIHAHASGHEGHVVDDARQNADDACYEVVVAVEGCVEPFAEGGILAALNRAGGDPSLNALAAASCGGIYGQALAMARGGWFKDILAAAAEIASADTLAKAGEVSLKYADEKRKTELLRQVGRIYFQELKKSLSSGDMRGSVFLRPTLEYAVEAADRAVEDAAFNAPFGALLFDLTAGVVTENDKWKKLLV